LPKQSIKDKKLKPKAQPRADKTRRLILKAAIVLFSRHGYAGTKILAIAKKARVNHSLIFHHFENKKSLWVAAKQQIETDQL
jgi:AcrR family transcriptional regulator